MASVPSSAAPRRIAFQGRPGAYSHLACVAAYPEHEALPRATFEDAFAAVHEGLAERAMIPIENSLAGRVADIHHLMPKGRLHIVAEHFQRVNHHLLGLLGTSVEDLVEVHSHPQALGQCRATLRKLGLVPRAHADTAGAAAEVAERGDRTAGAVASRLAAEIHGLAILRSDLEDAGHNTTRFVVLAAEPAWPLPNPGRVLTSFVFVVRNVPAALYKALGGFATHGVNMTKLESYIDGAFVQAQFYADVLGHPSEPGLAEALRELRFFSQSCTVLGVSPASPFRDRLGAPLEG